MIKALAFDIDGTLVDKTNTLDKKLKNLLIELQKENYQIIFATGRSLSGVQHLINQIILDDQPIYAVCYNGGVIYKIINNQRTIIHQELFTKKVVTDIYQLLKNDFQTIVTYNSENISATSTNSYVTRGAKLMNLEVNSDIFHDSPKVLIYSSPYEINNKFQVTKNLIANYNSKINVFSSASHIIEITPEKSVKSFGLSLFKDSFADNEILCFGDSENDESMFEYCLHSVAMGNATSKIKELARYQTLTNTENGVYWFLKNKLGDINEKF